MSVGEYRLLYEMYHMHILFFERYANAFYFSVRVSSSHVCIVWSASAEVWTPECYMVNC